MKLEHVPFKTFIVVTTSENMPIQTASDRWCNARWICAWCEVSMYIGTNFMQVPEDLRSCFLSPQNYEKYRQIIEEWA